MKIALLQAAAKPLDTEVNLATLTRAANEAAAAGAELVLTPELFLTGYAPDLLAEWMTSDRVSGIPEQVANIARTSNIAVAASFPLARADGTFAITAALWNAAGVQQLRYEKVHLWGAAESRAFVAGTQQPPLVQWNGRKVGFQICYDIEFAEPIRSLAVRGADLVLVPTAIDAGSSYVPELLVRARAAENNLVVAYADYPGTDATVGSDMSGFAGLSTVAGREGHVIACAGEAATLLFAEVPAVAPVSAGHADYLADRRLDVYTNWQA